MHYDSSDLSLHLKETNWKSVILDEREREKSTVVTSVRNNMQESLSYALPGVFIRLQYDYAAA